MSDKEEAAQREKALTTTLVKGTLETGTQPSPLLPCLICLLYVASKCESLQVDSVSRADSAQGVGVLPTSH